MSQRPLVVVTDHLVEAGAETPVLQDVAELRLLGTDDEADIIRQGGQADVLLVYHTIKISRQALEALPRLRAVIRCGVGFDNIDVESAGRRGVVVCNVPDYGTEEVADHALLLLLAVARRLLPAHEAIRSGGWDLTRVFGAPRLRGRTLGVVGCGRIGTALVMRAKALGMRVVIHDPYLPDGIEKALAVERAWRLEDLLPQAEFLSLHCPLTRETHHLLNRRTLALLPRGAYVINTARGPCLDLPALHDALESGQVAYAGLDVFEREPLADERIRAHPRVVLTPHAAFYSVEGFEEMRTKGAQEARRVLLGEPVRNPVNLHCLAGPRAAVPPAARLTPGSPAGT
jgi:D-3-phosphoglycerate dehydrogenase